MINYFSRKYVVYIRENYSKKKTSKKKTSFCSYSLPYFLYVSHYNFKVARKCTHNVVDLQRASDVGGNCVLRDD